MNYPFDAKRLVSLRIGKAGKAKRHDADLVLIGICRELFSALDPSVLATVYAGTLITNRLHGPMRMKESRFFGEYATIESFLVAERIFVETSHKLGHSLMEVRVLYELLECGPLSCVQLAERLLVSKAAVTAAAKTVEKQGWVERAIVPGDRRFARLLLTEDGRAHTEAVVVEVDRRSVEGVREWNSGETQAYAEMSRVFVESQRSARSR